MTTVWSEFLTGLKGKRIEIYARVAPQEREITLVEGILEAADDTGLVIRDQGTGLSTLYAQHAVLSVREFVPADNSWMSTLPTPQIVPGRRRPF